MQMQHMAPKAKTYFALLFSCLRQTVLRDARLLNQGDCVQLRLPPGSKLLAIILYCFHLRLAAAVWQARQTDDWWLFEKVSSAEPGEHCTHARIDTYCTNDLLLT